MPRDDDCAPPANANTALADAAASRPDSLQAKFAEWQKKKAARAAKKQAKLRAALDASAGAKRSSKAEAPDDAGAKDENDRPVAALAQPKLQPKKAYVAAAYASSDRAQDILDKVTSFFTTDAGFLGSVQSWLGTFAAVAVAPLRCSARRSLPADQPPPPPLPRGPWDRGVGGDAQAGGRRGVPGRAAQPVEGVRGDGRGEDRGVREGDVAAAHNYYYSPRLSHEHVGVATTTHLASLRYIALEGSSLGELFNLARDRSKEAYSDADMFIKLLSACTTFKFFVDMLQRAQGEGGFKFTTTTGLDPSYNV